LVEEIDRFGAVVDDVDLVTFAGEQVGQGGLNIRIILDDEYPRIVLGHIADYGSAIAREQRACAHTGRAQLEVPSGCNTRVAAPVGTLTRTCVISERRGQMLTEPSGPRCRILRASPRERHRHRADRST